MGENEKAPGTAYPEFKNLIILNGKEPLETAWQKWCFEIQPAKPKKTSEQNYGIPTGPANGIIVLDIDDKEKFQAYCEKNNITMPETFTVKTGKGHHFYFEYPPNGHAFGSKNQNKLYGFDIRGIGGQVVAPGSIHPDTGKIYQVVKKLPFAPMPDWMKDLYKEPEKPNQDVKTCGSFTGDIEKLPIKQSTKDLIKAGLPVGQRSEAIMTVLNALVWSNLSDSEIYQVFESYSIGEKYREQRNPEKWLRPQIDKARATITDRAEQKTDSGLMDEISAIAGMNLIARELERNKIAEKYNIRKSVIDQFLKALEKERDAGTTEIVTPAVAWETAVDGAGVLADIKALLNKHIVLPDGTADAIAAWVLLTYSFDAFRILPILGVVSPEKRCGKTTLLEVLQGLCSKALLASNVSPPAVFRTIEKYQPTLLIDEADTFLRDNEELRGVLNSGHTRAAAFVIRIQGDDHEPVRFSTWAPKAIAMIGELPGTLHDRSIMVKLRRKAPGEKVAKLDVDFENRCSEVRRKCQRWADDNVDALRTINPQVPENGNDRATDNWFPLFCITNVCGGQWSELLKKSMLGGDHTDDGTITIQLLSDIRDILKDHPHDRIFSDSLIEKLKSFQDHPWAEWNRGKGLSQNGLARLLKPFSIYSHTKRIGEERRNGYEKKSFDDTFKRYLSPETPFQTVTTRQPNNHKAFGDFQSVTKKNDVMDENGLKSLPIRACHDVTDEKGVYGKRKAEEEF
jgi:hypothetical protein